MVAEVMEQAIRRMRSQTRKGTIHLNTNASIPGAVERLCAAGLQSMRVSLNSVRAEFYERYYQPQGYAFNDVVRSIDVGRKHGLFVSLNYLVMPGLTDSVGEVAALLGFLREHTIDMIQWRNLNYDPVAYWAELREAYDDKPIGIRNLLWEVQRRFPRILHGYFNPGKERWKRAGAVPGGSL